MPAVTRQRSAPATARAHHGSKKAATGPQPAIASPSASSSSSGATTNPRFYTQDDLAMFANTPSKPARATPAVSAVSDDNWLLSSQVAEIRPPLTSRTAHTGEDAFAAAHRAAEKYRRGNPLADGPSGVRQPLGEFEPNSPTTKAEPKRVSSSAPVTPSLIAGGSIKASAVSVPPPATRPTYVARPQQLAQPEVFLSAAEESRTGSRLMESADMRQLLDVERRLSDLGGIMQEAANALDAADKFLHSKSDAPSSEQVHRLLRPHEGPRRHHAAAATKPEEIHAAAPAPAAAPQPTEEAAFDATSAVEPTGPIEHKQDESEAQIFLDAHLQRCAPRNVVGGVLEDSDASLSLNAVGRKLADQLDAWSKRPERKNPSPLPAAEAYASTDMALELALMQQCNIAGNAGKQHVNDPYEELVPTAQPPVSSSAEFAPPASESAHTVTPCPSLVPDDTADMHPTPAPASEAGDDAVTAGESPAAPATPANAITVSASHEPFEAADAVPLVSDIAPETQAPAADAVLQIDAPTSDVEAPAAQTDASAVVTGKKKPSAKTAKKKTDASEVEQAPAADANRKPPLPKFGKAAPIQPTHENEEAAEEDVKKPAIPTCGRAAPGDATEECGSPVPAPSKKPPLPRPPRASGPAARKSAEPADDVEGTSDSPAKKPPLPKKAAPAKMVKKAPSAERYEAVAPPAKQEEVYYYYVDAPAPAPAAAITSAEERPDEALPVTPTAVVEEPTALEYFMANVQADRDAACNPLSEEDPYVDVSASTDVEIGFAQSTDAANRDATVPEATGESEPQRRKKKDGGCCVIA